MASETVAENDSVLGHLDPQSADDVLEVGFGHGRTIAEVARRVPLGTVVGVDVSPDMVDFATQRYRALVDAGRVRLLSGDSAELPFVDHSFDRAFAVHTLYFWSPPGQHLRELWRVLRPGGRLVLGFRPSSDAEAAAFPASVYTFYAEQEVSALLAQSGFVDVTIHSAQRGTAIAVARRPTNGSARDG